MRPVVAASRMIAATTVAVTLMSAVMKVRISLLVSGRPGNTRQLRVRICTAIRRLGMDAFALRLSPCHLEFFTPVLNDPVRISESFLSLAVMVSAQRENLPRHWADSSNVRARTTPCSIAYAKVRRHEPLPSSRGRMRLRPTSTCVVMAAPVVARPTDPDRSQTTGRHEKRPPPGEGDGLSMSRMRIHPFLGRRIHIGLSL
jgi:hypothetical protein